MMSMSKYVGMVLDMRDVGKTIISFVLPKISYFLLPAGKL